MKDFVNRNPGVDLEPLGDVFEKVREIRDEGKAILNQVEQVPDKESKRCNIL